MKIGILTQPLHNNYGGILQAYALQKTLINLGHEVWTVDIPFKRKKIRIDKGTIKRFFYRYVFQNDIPVVLPVRPSEFEKKIISQHTLNFINTNILTTEHISTVSNIRKLKKYNFDAFIVGSDQVWRLRYSPGILTYFLDFIENNTHIKRIAYAASFGVDNWEFSSGLTKKIKKLAQRFDAISVRENSGINLCVKFLKVNAIKLPDPTLLLTREDYINIAGLKNVSVSKKTMMVYILDKTADKMEIVEKLNKRLRLVIKTVMPKMSFSHETRKNIEHCIYPPVSEWLRGFIDAEFIVTDSFHGTIFAILFRKPFVTIGNHKRGLERFISLLNQFNLDDRLVLADDLRDINNYLKPIDYEEIEKIIMNDKQKAFNFLSEHLSNI